MFVSDIYSFHFQGMHDLMSQHGKVGAKEEKDTTIEEAKAFRRLPIVNLHKEDKNLSALNSYHKIKVVLYSEVISDQIYVNNLSANCQEDSL